MYGEGGYGGGRSQGGFGGGFAPVKVGEEIDVKIEAVGEKGDGIARKSGFVLFVPSTREGDEVRIRITKVLRKVGFAEVIGQSQGAPAGDSRDEARSAPAHEAPHEAPSYGDAPAPEDTEDFGEEAPAEPAEEAPAEEPEMEAPPLPEEESPAEEPEAPAEEAPAEPAEEGKKEE